MSRKKSQAYWRQFPLPVLRLLSVVSLAVCGLSGNGVQHAPGLPPGLIDLAFLFFRELLVGNEIFHTDFLLIWFLKSVYHTPAKMHK